MQAEVSGASDVERGDKLFEVGEHDGADFIGGSAIEREFEDAVAHSQRSAWPVNDFMPRPFRSYMELISAS